MTHEFCLKMSDFHVTFSDLLHAVNLRHGTNGFTSLPKEGVLWIFSPWKIRRFRPGLNPRTWVPKGSTLPLDHRNRSTSGVGKLPEDKFRQQGTIIWQFSVIDWSWLYFIVLLMRVTLITVNFSTQYSLRLFQASKTHTRNTCFNCEWLVTNRQSLRLPLGFKYFSISICDMEWMLASVTYFTEGAAD